MSTTPTSTPAGRAILLNGPSSAGKSTLARHLQAVLPTPFLILSSDMLAEHGCLPPQRDTRSTEANDIWSWRAVMRPRFFAGWHGCIAAMVKAGNDVIVDHVVEYVEWWRELRSLLGERDVWVVGVECEIGEMERRERERGDGRFVGEGRAHLEQLRVHEIVAEGLELGSREGYDDVVDTTFGVVEQMSKEILEKWVTRQKLCWTERLMMRD